MERRFVAQALSNVTLETREEGQPPAISGYGAVFYDGNPGTEYKLWSNAIERIMPSAFDRAAKEDDVRGLFNHDPNMLLGRTSSGTMKLSVDSRGLKYEIEPPDTQCGRDTVTSLKRKDLTGSSFAFIVKSETWRDEGDISIREINEVELYDCGPVTFPAYVGTTSGMRSEQVAECRASFDAWKATRETEESAEETREDDAAQDDSAALHGKLASYAARARVVEIET